MMKPLSLIALVAVVMFARPARADERADISDALSRVATAADSFARSANASEDRAVRRKLATKAREISEDLTSLARRARKDVPLKTIARDAQNLGRDTAALVDLADEAEDKAERKSLRAQATVIDQQLAAVRRQIDDAAGADKPAQPAKPAPMTNDAFAALWNTVKQQSFDSNKLNVLKQAANANWFNSAQMASMMDLFSFGAGKVDAAVAMWPHMVDPENLFVLYNKLTFSSDKDNLRKRTTTAR